MHIWGILVLKGLGHFKSTITSIEQTVLSKSCNKDQQHVIAGVEAFILGMLTLIYVSSRSLDQILDNLVVADLGMDFPQGQNSSNLQGVTSRGCAERSQTWIYKVSWENLPLETDMAVASNKFSDVLYHPETRGRTVSFSECTI